MNDRPAGGRCWIDKDSGVAMNTEFNISCEGWQDPDEPLSYTFGLNSETEKPPTILHDSESPFLLKPILVEQGLAANNYTKTFYAKITDKYGAFTKVDDIKVTVLPRPKRNTDEPVSISQELGGLVNNIEDLAGEGDAGAMASLCASLAGELNLEATGDTESTTTTPVSTTAAVYTTEEEASYVFQYSYVPTTEVPKTKKEIAEQQRKDRTKMRENMSKQVVKGASSAADIGDAQQILSACVKLTQEPTEMSTKTSGSVMTTLNSLLVLRQMFRIAHRLKILRTRLNWSLNLLEIASMLT
ncbi:uncharacterized protein [Amphiura filiformis]|uniref:uncharacterized protein n=1 Tax=Amphiura filiformis TaxID=82378 RepID=UPI003B20BDA0